MTPLPELTSLSLDTHPTMDSSWARYCPRCAAPLVERLDAESILRKLCSKCGFVFYLNPKTAAASIPREGGGVWLIKRDTHPGRGLWTFPGGYVDLGELVTEAAIRETLEETLLSIRIDGLLNVYSYRQVGVIVVVYHATVVGGSAGPTSESQEVRCFHPSEIPWSQLAFPSTCDALTDYLKLDP